MMADGFGQARTAAQPVRGLRAGIDPGKHGWVVVELLNGTLRGFPIPTVDDDYDQRAILQLMLKLRCMGVVHVTLEAQQPAMRRGSQKLAGAENNAVRASFMIGFGFGLLCMALRAAGLAFDLAWPSVWKKSMGLVPRKDIPEREREQARKVLSRKRAQAEWPAHDFRPSQRARVASHDYCEAALLIRYGQQRFSC